MEGNLVGVDLLTKDSTSMFFHYFSLERPTPDVHLGYCYIYKTPHEIHQGNSSML